LVVSDENENTLIQREPLKELAKFIWVSLMKLLKKKSLIRCRTD
jgi:hypothetical protein